MLHPIVPIYNFNLFLRFGLPLSLAARATVLSVSAVVVQPETVSMIIGFVTAHNDVMPIKQVLHDMTMSIERHRKTKKNIPYTRSISANHWWSILAFVEELVNTTCLIKPLRSLVFRKKEVQNVLLKYLTTR